jgi:hypothetical protein
MAYLTDYKYYENDGNEPEYENWGSYQYSSLHDIVNNFMLMYVGDDKLVNNIQRHIVLFHAKRAIQELNYDAMKETKVVELSVWDDLKIVLPPDFINWVRLSIYKDGLLRPLTENYKANYATSYLQDNDARVLFDSDGGVLKGSSMVDYERITKLNKTEYLGEGAMSGHHGYEQDGSWYFDYEVGSRFGINTETANANPTFSIDKRNGVINFSSDMSDEIVVIEYISDGMANGDDDMINVNKLFEEYVYAYIRYMILSSKFNVQEYIVNRSRKEKTALLRNAKIRISNMHPGRLLMSARGQNKMLK